ncbi:MAG: hypothetical protein LBB53_00530 [Prevotellaceae bacterium]|jgi:hypothetical protein|nr:hypothetical protein [Prevotellaceae bacterium]
MVYKFVLISDESENFIREIEIDSEATFLEFQKAIIQSVKYSNMELTTFFLCSDNWEKEQEIMFMEMDSDSSVDTYLMADTKLEDLVEDEGQKLLFVFDMLTERSFFIELKEVLPSKSLKKPVCTFSRGIAPAQTVNLDELLEKTVKKGNAQNLLDDDFFDDCGYNDDELDAEGFSDLSFDEY